MPAPPMRGNLHVCFYCVELRFIIFCEPQVLMQVSFFLKGKTNEAAPWEAASLK